MWGYPGCGYGGCGWIWIIIVVFILLFLLCPGFGREGIYPRNFEKNCC